MPLGCLNEQPRSGQYLRSLYFALVTVSTVGYGDLSPRRQRRVERAKAGSDDCASELIKVGGSASSADDGGAGRLRAAACAGDACLIERLIKAGLRPDACADDGRTALHLAAGEGASRVAAKLVELGADVKKPDRQGRNALDIARAAGYYDLEARLRLLAES